MRKLFQLANNAEYGIFAIEDVPGVHSVFHDSRQRLVVYTDGSCLFPRHQTLAHAGWGVVYSTTHHDLNEHGPVLSIVQTSYRAEVRAVAQALARCKVDVLVCSDCRSVVNQLQQYIETRQRNATTAAPELWEVIYDLLDASCDADNLHVAIKWIPAHLDDEDKASKREAYLAAGDANI